MPILAALLLHENKFMGGLGDLQLNVSHNIGNNSNTGDNDDRRPWFSDDDAQNEIFYGGSIEVLTLHDNRLNEAIASDFTLPPSIKYFTANDNKIPGKIPKSLFSGVNTSTEITVLLSDNRLS